MKVRTSRFGEIDIDEGAVLSLTGGLIGFPDEENYVIIRHNPESPFFWLQSVDREDLAFVIVDPRVFKPDYKIDLSKSLLARLQTESAEELGIYVIVTIPQGRPEAMTANLLGPLVVSAKTRLGRQVVLDESKYSHRHPIMPPGEE